jgi:hypothetical protein
MRTPSVEDLLTVWECGRAEPHLARRALILLSALYPDVSPGALAGLSIGARDRLLLALRQQVFGAGLEALVACPSCRETLEVAFDIADVRAEAPSRDEPFTLRTGEYDLEFRLPNSLDLLAIDDTEALEDRRARLLGRLIVRASRGTEQVSYPNLPEEVLAQIEQVMQDADPQADISLKLNCRACGHQWPCLFDIVSFLTKELDAWAIRMLRDVHMLARAYGWREADVLQMRPWRRQCYLEMLNT